MKILDHRADPGQATRHGADHIELISIVDAHVGISRPDEDSVDAAIPLVKIVQVPIDCVFLRDRIVEVAVVHHHLRLDERRASPLQSRQLIEVRNRGELRAGESDADAPLHAPVRYIVEPLPVG